MADKYNNLWTKLGLGGLRGSKLFKGLWRAARVGAVYAGLYFVVKVVPGLNFLPPEILALAGTAAEKWLREYIKQLDF